MKILILTFACLIFSHANEANFTQNFALNSTPNFTIFYDENATDEQIDSALDTLIAFATQNPQRINDEFGEYNDRIFTQFIFNSKIANSAKFDFERIKAILKFAPDLNYNKGEFYNPLSIANSYGCDIGSLSLSNSNASKFDAGEVLALVDLLVAHGATPDNEHATTAATCDNFDIFAYLLANGAQVENGVISAITAGELMYMIEQNITMQNLTKAPSSDLKRLAQTYDFSKFHANKMRFFEESLKYKAINELDKRELEGFIKFSAMSDNFVAVQFLLENGICEKDINMCAYIKAQAKYFEAEKISDMLSLELKHRF